MRWATEKRVKPNHYEIRADYPIFHGGPLAKLASDTIREEVMRLVRQYQKDFEAEPPREEFSSSMGWRATVSLNRPTLVSVLGQCSYYLAGAAHPGGEYRAFNFALLGGAPKRIGLADIMTVRMTPEAFAASLVWPKLRAMGAALAETQYGKNLTREQADNFVITPSGLTWPFVAGEMGAYAQGDFIVKISWEELGNRIRPDIKRTATGR